jgi:oxygen-independent coproporphyrinogen-3 oxidase
VTPPNIPDDDHVADMYLNAVKYLESNGFRQYEISNFSLPGRECRHNLKYWRCQEYLGYGPGAHSYYKDARYSYIRDLAAYIDAMKTGSEGLIDGDPEIIRPRERVGEYLMLGLRLREGISEADYKRKHARDFGPIRAALLPYVKTGHVREEDGRFSLTPEGFLISNRIISDVLDAAREEGTRS